MASLMRGLSRLGPKIISANRRLPLTLPKVSLPSAGKTFQPVCFISTSKKNKDAVTLSDKSSHDTPAKPEVLENLGEKEENWISHGYSLVDRDFDEWIHHAVTFCVFTLVFCWGSFFIMYYPDYLDNAWAQREAYLELARREKEGLPLIDRNLIDPSKIDLPSEEELGDFNIVI